MKPSPKRDDETEDAYLIRLIREDERERCAAIIQAAREGKIDGDFRSLIFRIRNPD